MLRTPEIECISAGVRYLGVDDCLCVQMKSHGSGGGAQPIRSRMWSPTRMALAIAVRAGFTALMLGKMLVSAT